MANVCSRRVAELDKRAPQLLAGAQVSNGGSPYATKFLNLGGGLFFLFALAFARKIDVNRRHLDGLVLGSDVHLGTFNIELG